MDSGSQASARRGGGSDSFTVGARPTSLLVSCSATDAREWWAVLGSPVWVVRRYPGVSCAALAASELSASAIFIISAAPSCWPVLWNPLQPAATREHGQSSQ